jgi:translation initiation factor 1
VKDEAMSKRRGGVVWSSGPEAQQRCERCGRSPCVCPPAVYPLPEKQTARLGRSRKGRGGKTVVTIEGLVLDEAGLMALARTVRRRCGAGGTVKDGVIEIQGDIRDRVAETLRALGYRVKLIGA